MMNTDNKLAALALIQLNIEKYGYHIYIVAGNELPRFAYTIGVSKLLGAEFILAGAAYYSAEDVRHVIDKITSLSHATPSAQDLNIDGMGRFSFKEVHPSWAEKLLLGAFDYYKKKEIRCLQIVPDQDHSTLDTPNLTNVFDPAKEPVWRWLTEPWQFPVVKTSTATTNIAALRGDAVTEAMRWEEDCWELFAGAGPDVDREDIRVVPLATLLAIDSSLEIVANLQVERGVWRDGQEGEWHTWGDKE